MTTTEVGRTAPGIDTEEQAELRRTVLEILRRRGGPEAVRAAMSTVEGHDPALWEALAGQVGAAALSVPEERGGVGAGWIETHVVLDELGAGPTPSPLLGTVLATQALLVALAAGAAGSTDSLDSEHDELLAGLAAGEVLGALCWAGARGWGVPGVVAADGSLAGVAHYVVGGHVADALVVVARVEDSGAADDVALYLVDGAAAGVRRERVVSLDPTRPLAVVEFNGVAARRISPVEPAAAPTGIVARLRTLAAVAVSAGQVGAARAALDLTVEYTRNRVQFGRPIGSFQALKHRMADMYVAVETARSISYSAAAAYENWEAAPAEAVAEARAARLWCTEAARLVAAESIQLHGGIGITWEADPQLYFKRAQADGELFGTAGGR